MKLLVIDGKEIVPVRWIPFITQSAFGRVMISQILTHRWDAGGFPKAEYNNFPETNEDGEEIISDDLKSDEQEQNFYAYRLNDEGIPVRMLTTEWDIILWEIEPHRQLAKHEEKKTGIRGIKQNEWHTEALKILPADAFMWREDFELMWQAYLDTYSRHQYELRDGRLFNYDAHIDDKYKAIVWEGFQSQLSASKKPEIEPKESTRTIETLQKMLVAMAIDGYSYDPKAKQNGDALKDIRKGLDDIGLSICDNTIRNHLKAGYELINRIKIQ